MKMTAEEAGRAATSLPHATIEFRPQPRSTNFSASMPSTPRMDSVRRSDAHDVSRRPARLDRAICNAACSVYIVTATDTAARSHNVTELLLLYLTTTTSYVAHANSRVEFISVDATCFTSDDVDDDGHDMAVVLIGLVIVVISDADKLAPARTARTFAMPRTHS